MSTGQMYPKCVVDIWQCLEVVSKPRFGRLRGKHPLSERGGDESRADGCPVSQDSSAASQAESEAQGWSTPTPWPEYLAARVVCRFRLPIALATV